MKLRTALKLFYGWPTTWLAGSSTPCCPRAKRPSKCWRHHRTRRTKRWSLDRQRLEAAAAGADSLARLPESPPARGTPSSWHSSRIFKLKHYLNSNMQVMYIRKAPECCKLVSTRRVPAEIAHQLFGSHIPPPSPYVTGVTWRGKWCRPSVLRTGQPSTKIGPYAAAALLSNQKGHASRQGCQRSKKIQQISVFFPVTLQFVNYFNCCIHLQFLSFLVTDGDDFRRINRHNWIDLHVHSDKENRKGITFAMLLSYLFPAFYRHLTRIKITTL